ESDCESRVVLAVATFGNGISIYTMALEALAAIRDTRDSDRDPGGDGPDPSRACVRSGRDPLPNSRCRSAHHRDEVLPIEHRGRVVESNSRDATCSVFPRDTSNHQPTQIQVPAAGEEQPPREAAVADRRGYRQIPERLKLAR